MNAWGAALLVRPVEGPLSGAPETCSGCIRLRLTHGRRLGGAASAPGEHVASRLLRITDVGTVVISISCDLSTSGFREPSSMGASITRRGATWLQHGLPTARATRKRPAQALF